LNGLQKEAVGGTRMLGVSLNSFLRMHKWFQAAKPRELTAFSPLTMLYVQGIPTYAIFPREKKI
jgi:hypothetical protein